MDATGSAEMAVFGEFRLAADGGGLFRCVDGDRLVPISIGSRALSVLVVLVARPGELVSKDEIMAAVWPGTVVEEANLSVQLSKLRRVLDSGLHGESHIQTVPGRGYRLTRPVTSCPAPKRGARLGPLEQPAAPVGVTAPAATKRRLPAAFIIAGASMLLTVLAVGFAWRLHIPKPPRPDAYAAQDRRRSVMVLPFQNSGDDPAQNGLAAGITRDVTDMIATDTGVPIVAPASGLVDQRSSADLRLVGREYDVHFVLSGHARRHEGRLSVSATIFQTDSARTVWTQRYDSPDRPDALRSIIQNIGDNFDEATEDSERARAKIEHPNDLDKRDLLFAANATSLLQPSAENYRARIALATQALALDPNFVWALRKVGILHAERVLLGFSSDREADLSIAAKATDRAFMLAPKDVSVLRTKATVLRASRDWKGAEALLRKVIELQPMVADSYIALAQSLMENGSYAEALDTLRTAQDLIEPGDDAKYLHLWMATALVANERYAEAIAPARLATLEFPPESGAYGEPAWLALIAAEIENGQDAEGRADLRRFLGAPRQFHTIGTVQNAQYLVLKESVLNGLRRAGMPTN